MSDELIPPIIVDIIVNGDEATAAVDEFRDRVAQMAGAVDDSTVDVSAAFDEQGAAAARVAETVDASVGAIADAEARVADAASASADVQADAADRVEAAQARLAAVLTDTAASAGADAARMAEEAGASADAQADAAGRAAAAQVESAGEITRAQRAAGIAAAEAAKAAGLSADEQAAASGRAIEAQAALEGKTVEGSSIFTRVGDKLASFGVPFAGSLQKAGASIDDADSKAARFGETLSHTGAVISAVGAAAGIYIGVKSVEAFDELDQAQTRLQVAVKNSGASWDAYVPKLDKAYSKAVDLGFKNVDVANTLQMLTTATDSPTKALGDLGLAEDLAREKNESLADAGQTLARVYAGSNRALTQLGLNLDIGSAKLSSLKTAEDAVTSAQLKLKDTQQEIADGAIKSTEASQDLAQAHLALSDAIQKRELDEKTLGTVMDALEQRTKGAAAAFGKTLPGEIQHAEAAFNHIEDAIGGDLDPILKSLAGDLDSVLDFFEHNTTAAEILGGVIATALAVPVAAFAFNVAKSFIGSLIDMGEGVVNFGANLLGLDPVFEGTQSAEQQTAAALQAAADSMAESASTIAESLSTVGAAAQSMAGETEGATATADTAIAGIATSSATMASDVEASTATTKLALESVGGAAGTAATEVAAAEARVVEAVTTADTEIEARNEAAGLSYADLIPGVGIALGIGLLASQFIHLGSTETSEAEAARIVTAAKNAEAQALLNAQEAAFATGNAYFAMKDAQLQVVEDHEAMTAAVDKYGAHSLQAQQATEQYRQAVLDNTEAIAQYAQSQQNQTAKTADAERAARKLVETTRDQIEFQRALNSIDDGGANAAQKLARDTREYEAALKALQGANAQASISELNKQRYQQGTVEITGQAVEKVQALTDIYGQLPRSVQTSLAADSTDALEKIAGVITDLQQRGIGTPTIVHLLGDSSNAQQAITDLENRLDQLPPEAMLIGKEAGDNLVSAFRSAVAGGLSVSPASDLRRLAAPATAAVQPAAPAAAGGAGNRESGIHIGTMNINGYQKSEAEITGEMVRQLRPYLTAAPY